MVCVCLQMWKKHDVCIKNRLTSASLNKQQTFCFEFILSGQFKSPRTVVKVHNEDNWIRENKEGGRDKWAGWNEQEKMQSLFWHLFVLGVICKTAACNPELLCPPPNFFPNLSIFENLFFITQNQSITWLNGYMTSLQSLVFHQSGSSIRHQGISCKGQNTYLPLCGSCLCV